MEDGGRGRELEGGMMIAQRVKGKERIAGVDNCRPNGVAAIGEGMTRKDHAEVSNQLVSVILRGPLSLSFSNSVNHARAVVSRRTLVGLRTWQVLYMASPV